MSWVPVRERNEQIARQAPFRFETTEPWANVEEVEIGGTRAIVWDRLTQTARSSRREEWQPYDYQTGALWRDRAVKFDGMAQTRQAVQLQRRVYRTVRFDTPPESSGPGARSGR